MSKFSAHLMVLSNLVAVARSLHAAGIPGASEYGDNNWSLTKEEMELYLGRELDAEEITLLSLSRAFGPTPAFSDDDDARMVVRNLWPSGNEHGLRYDWDQLVEELITFRDGNNNCVLVHSAGLRGVYIVTLRENPEQGYLTEEVSENAWFGNAASPSSYDMPCLGWFGPAHSWDNAEQGIRSLSGYTVDAELMIAVVRFQLLWDQGRMDAAGLLAQPWHDEAFAAQLWQSVTADEAWDRAIAALLKLRAILDVMPDCAEQSRCWAALDEMGHPRK